MKLGILGPGKKAAAYTTNRLIEEAQKKFKEVDLIPIADVKLKIDKDMEAFIEKKNLKDYDYILPRIDSKKASIAYPVISFLDYMGVKKPYSSNTILFAHNKFLTLLQLAKNSIPVPETYLTASNDVANKILEKQKLPAVIKLLSGFGGQGVIIIESKDAAKSTIETMKKLKQEILIEKFIKNHGEDIRGIVAGEEVIASYKRIAKEGELRANIKAGGKGMSFKLTGEMENTVLKAAEAIKSKICAIDLIEGKDGIKVLEANINPGVQGIERTTGLNVAGRIVDYILGEIKK